jgi:hypothetical protein
MCPGVSPGYFRRGWINVLTGHNAESTIRVTMTIRWNDRANDCGYDSFRHFMAIEYYLDPKGSLKSCTARLECSEASLLLAMGRDNLPTKRRGHSPRNGFFCMECHKLYPWHKLRHNLEGTKYVCTKCLEEERRCISKEAKRQDVTDQ